MKLNLSDEKFDEILNKGISLDHIYILKLIDEGFDVISKKNTPKWGILLQSLIRKGMLFETENKLTTIGKELLIFVNSKDRKKIVKPKVVSSEFDQWWAEYPGTTNFVYKGRKFIGDRSIRVGKDDCRTKFNKILLEGEHSAKDLIDALKYEILQKKEASIKTGVNKLTYMQNSLTYLNQRTYEGFIELIDSGAGVKIKQETTGEIEI
jgi:hypothetical protein